MLAGPKGSTDTLLGAPIILYDYPEVAEQSPGALFDSTEIDEILTLRVMTMTEEEKAEARATDPRAGEIIDRCDGMSPAGLQQLHGLLRDPHAPQPAALVGPPGDVRDVEPAAFDTAGAPWWDPAADASVRPESDAVVIDGVRVAKGSLVRVHPSRRADAQDLFFMRPGGPGDRGARGRGRRYARRPGPRRRPGVRPARLVRPLLLLRARRADTPERRGVGAVPRGEPIVKSLGFITAVVGAAVAAVSLGVAIRSIPDIRRYLRIRSM